MNFARLNHVLIPQSAEARMSWLRSKRRYRWLASPFRLYFALTPMGRGVLLFWLFAGALGLNVAQTVVYVLWSVITGALAASLILRRWFVLSDVALSADVPARVHVGAPLTMHVTMTNTGSVGYRDVRVQLPFLTWDGQYISLDGFVPKLPPRQSVTLKSVAKFSARGAHSLVPSMAMRVLPLGIASGPPIQSRITSFLVVPSFPQIRSIKLPTRDRCHPGGVPMATHTGEAMELAGVREYQIGDRARDLHAPTWARTGVPHVRQFQQEFFTRMGIILDVQQQGLSEAPFEGAISLTAGVLAHLSQKDALVDVLCTGNQFHELTIGRSVGVFQQGLDLLASIKPGEALNVHLLARRLIHYLDIMSGIIIVTSDFGESVRNLFQWCRAHQVPVRVLVVVKNTTSFNEGDSVTAVTLDDLKHDGGVWL